MMGSLRDDFANAQDLADTQTASSLARIIGQELRTHGPTRFTSRFDHGRSFNEHLKEAIMQSAPSANPYAKVIANSKRVRWDIEDDVLRGRRFDLGKTFLPAGLSLADELPFLTADDRRLFSQVQGRSYACIFGLVERFIGAKVLEISRAHCAGRPGRAGSPGAHDRRGAQAPGAVPPPRNADGRRHACGLRASGRTQRRRHRGARQEHLGRAGADAGHRAVHAGPLPRQHRAARPTSASCGGTCSCSTGRRSRSTRCSTSSSSCARTRALTPPQRDAAVGDLIDWSARSTASCRPRPRPMRAISCSDRGQALRRCQRGDRRGAFLKAYRWQYIVSGVMQPRFQKVLFGVLETGRLPG